MLLNTWAYCGDVPLVIAVDNHPDGSLYVNIVTVLLRIVIYAVLFALGIALGMRWFSTHQSIIRVLLFGFTGLILVAFVFVVDFSLFSGVTGHSYVPAKCPGGHPPGGRSATYPRTAGTWHGLQRRR